MEEGGGEGRVLVGLRGEVMEAGEEEAGEEVEGGGGKAVFVCRLTPTPFGG